MSNSNTMRPDSITIKDMDKASDLGTKKHGSDDLNDAELVKYNISDNLDKINKQLIKEIKN